MLFTVNAGFSGTRLGLCWIMLEERYEEFRGEVRDPYPSIGEKAVGRWGRYIGSPCIKYSIKIKLSGLSPWLPYLLHYMEEDVFLLC